MCVIAAIVKLDARERPEPDRLRRMLGALRHRGPDGEGAVVSGPVALGHCRLAIVDPAGGKQPMGNEDRSIWLVCNGEIYNHPELEPQLTRAGHVYRTRSDSETILHAYEDDGIECVERLRGMFAFALWDRNSRRLLLARDRLGIKPLYYAVSERELLFASEMKAIIAALPARARFNTDILPEFLANGFVAGEETFFAGIRKLLPGRVLTWQPEEGLRQVRYWSIPHGVASQPARMAERGEELREKLVDAVRSHLMADVPVGLFLSGGIDSTALAAVMAPLLPHRLETFSVGFAESTANEFCFARQAANRVGARHHDLLIRADEFFATVPELIRHEDEPIAFPASVPLYHVSRFARQHVKVVLTGEGADELFLGYNRYRVALWNERLGRAWGHAVPAGARAAVRREMGRLPGFARRYATRTFLGQPPGFRAAFFDNFAVFPEHRLTRLVDPALLETGRDPYAVGLACMQETEHGFLDGMMRADLQTYLVQLLMKQDRMSMAASLEARVPFLDHELVEYAVRIPTSLKLRGFTTKAVLREAVRPLVPAEILRRRKMGFPVPLEGWFRGPFRGLLNEFVLGARAVGRGMFRFEELQRLVGEHESGAVNHAHRLWLLVNLEMWHRIFIDNQDTSRVLGAAA